MENVKCLVWDGAKLVEHTPVIWDGTKLIVPDLPLVASWLGTPWASVSILSRGGVEVRRNLQPFPGTTATVRVLGIGNTSSSSGWGGITPAASTLDVTARPSTGKAGKITRLTLPTAGTTTAWQDLAIAAGDGIIPATPVTAYAAGIYVRASVALKVMLSLQGMTADNKSAGSLKGPPVTLGAGEWVWLTAGGTSSATVIKYRLDVDAADAIAFPAGATLDLDAAIIEQTTTIGKPFDGDNPPT